MRRAKRVRRLMRRRRPSREPAGSKGDWEKTPIERSAFPSKRGAMMEKVDLYDGAYGNYGAEVYRQIRVETYGEDLGQTSWVTTEESNEIPRMLGITAASEVLE